MRIIFKIARAELRNMFYSPVAWFVIFVFYAFAAAVYFLPQAGVMRMQDVFQSNKPDWIGFEKGLGNVLIIPMLMTVLSFLYLFIPLLTMGVVNREFNSGTIRLLYSSPVRTREIILGKYLGMVCFNVIFLLGFVLILATASVNIQHADTSWFLSVLMGLFLLVNTYTAIGLFISCLTQYQLVAAVLTFGAFFLLSATSGMGQQYDLVRDVTRAVSLSGKVQFMLMGLITSRDVIYFILIIFLFLMFAMIRIKSTQESKKWTVTFSRYALCLLLVLALGYLSSRPGYISYLDVTRNKINTLHPAVQDVLKKMDGSPVTVTLYTNLFYPKASAGLPQERNRYIWDFWERYIRFYPNLSFKYEYYYSMKEGDSSFYQRYPGKSIEEIAAIEAEILGIRKSLFKKAAEMENYADLKKEDFRMLMELEYKGKKAFLSVYNDKDVWPMQDDVAGTIMRLVRSKEVTVNFLTGHFERDPMRFTPRDYGNNTTHVYIRAALVNKGVDVDTVSVSDKPVPGNTDLLVIADPRSEYNEAELNHINRYIEEGGNALIFTEPSKLFILDPVLKKIGVQVEPGTLVHPNAHEMPHILVSKFTKPGNYMAKEKAMEYFQRYGERGGQITSEGTGNIIASPIDGFKVEAVITEPGHPNTWLEKGILVVDSAAPKFNPAEGDVKRDEYIIAVKMSRMINNKEQRIVVAADADFMSSKRISHGNIGHTFYSWGLNNMYPVYANYPIPEDRFLTISEKTAKRQIQLYVYGIPAFILLAATILLVRRKRK
ncbi:Gldg family protein [Pseudobacter ginsenosidimutans]|uniref:ABC-2 type transport system permease protein n=1 Tax=Pseudobacter ginsenosidimutans TaxID=661488 RepID=A0A4Q7MZ21_9BACT|nr:Gldg family protein [Pseudobacter ginsenosidimutans]QEC43144.1 ABC transporter permease subunit [Pseudobacter ginsenosidimutans]RZS74500.1 ABC-2 type transport system permease protein [Pseudobacter ginsenosidimutans]